MAEIVGEDLTQPLLPVYWDQESQKDIVEESLGHMGGFVDYSFFLSLLVHELQSFGEEERYPCKHV